ncbi:MAG: hypothetical protein M2R45_02020 [Verrucomicrobia subdivision 3 bacterium]|nr:hypothetical protein [Limisphaerales bacterium]MCS1414839.1 hypothetical protein [Limisphaerales bacterium]
MNTVRCLGLRTLFFSFPCGVRSYSTVRSGRLSHPIVVHLNQGIPETPVHIFGQNLATTTNGLIGTEPVTFQVLSETTLLAPGKLAPAPFGVCRGRQQSNHLDECQRTLTPYGSPAPTPRGIATSEGTLVSIGSKPVTASFD